MSTHEACPPFWPVSEQHGLRFMEIGGEVPSSVASAMPLVGALSSLTDALRDLQLADGSAVSEAAERALCEQVAVGLRELAEVVESEAGEPLRIRADAFAGLTSHVAASRRIAELPLPSGLSVLCGPLCTWRHKTRAPLYSFVAAVADDRASELVSDLDGALDEATAALQADLGLSDLAFDALYPMPVADLVACGGEANGHPKHYAYFLPEDEGVPDVPETDKWTLAFRNVYVERYRAISAPLSDVLLDGPCQAGDVAAEGALLSWLRGHDVGHAAQLPTTRYGSWHEAIGHEPFMMLQEALADVYGFLLSTSRPWLDVTRLSPLDCSASFLAELLHYMRRGPWHYGDSGAAYLELSYLAVNGHVDVRPDGTVRWTLEGLCRGMRELAVELGDAILAAQDPRPPSLLVHRYGWPATTPALQVLAVLQWELKSIPTTLAYRESGGGHEAPGLQGGAEASALAALVDWSAPARARGMRIPT